jgi:imidazolonepropionase-like amidohydrolase
LVGPTPERLGPLETNNASVENTAILVQAGVPVALMTGLKATCQESSTAVRGRSRRGQWHFEGALRDSTIEAANILGIAYRVGSLKPDKDADVVLYDSDPF